MDVKDIFMADKIFIALLLLLLTYTDSGNAVPLKEKSDVSPFCKVDKSPCFYQPEDACWTNDDCAQYNSYMSVCCPHACPGYKQCQYIKVKVKPATTQKPTEYEATTNKVTTADVDTIQPTDEMWTTTEVPYTKEELTSTTVPATSGVVTELPTTKNEPSTQVIETTMAAKTTVQTTTTLPATELPESTSTLEPTTQQETLPPSTEGLTTEQIPSTILPTTMLSTTMPTTTELPPTTRITTEIPETVPPRTTEKITTPKTTYKPVTTKPTKDGICHSQQQKNILFIVDGTAHPRQYPHFVDAKFNQLKQYVKSIITRLENENFMIGVMQFGGKRKPKMEVDFAPATDKSWLLSGVESMRQFKGTERRLSEALAMANNEFYELKALYDRQGSQNIVVYITRGYLQLRPVKAEIEILKRKSVKVITVGVSNSQPKVYLENQLFEIASSIKDVHMVRYKDLENVEEAVFQGICSSFIAAGTNSVCGRQRKDVYFVIDGSASISHSSFEKKRDFLASLLTLLQNPKSELNIGMMQFSEKSKTRELMPLDEHLFENEEKLVRNIHYDNGRKTMLGYALQRFNQTVFTGNGGDRPDVDNILVLFSDGRAHDIDLALKMAESIKKRGIRVITFTVVNGADTSSLSKMASSRNDFVNVDLKKAAFFAQKLAALICPAPKRKL